MKRQLQEQLTARLPEWFGQPESNRQYAAQAEVLPGYIARVDGVPKGMLLLKKHSDISAEIYWLAVDRDCHRVGLGRTLVNAGCERAQTEEAKFLFVYTLHPDAEYEPYGRTRLVYEAMGFRYMLEEQFADEGQSARAIHEVPVVLRHADAPQSGQRMAIAGRLRRAIQFFAGR